MVLVKWWVLAAGCAAGGRLQGGAGQRERCEGEGFGLLVDQAAQINLGADGGGLDLRARGVELGVGLGGDGQQAGEGDVCVPGDQLALAFLDVAVLDGVGLRVDLAAALALGGVGDDRGLGALHVAQRGLESLGHVYKGEGAAHAAW